MPKKLTKKFLTSFFALVLFGTISSAITLFAPFGSEWIETAIAVFFITGLLWSLCLLLSKGDLLNRAPSQWPIHYASMFSFMLVAIAVGFPSISRYSQAERLQWEVNGKVVKTYNSSNHQSESVEIVDKNGELYQWEDIDRDAWLKLKPGDTIRKESWSPFATVNGEPIRLVPYSILDGVRGIDTELP